MSEGAKSIGAGATIIALAGVAVSIGNVFSSLIYFVAKNPSLAKQSFGYAILGFALTEIIVLFASMMVVYDLIRLLIANKKEKVKHKNVNFFDYLMCQYLFVFGPTFLYFCSLMLYC